MNEFYNLQDVINIIQQKCQNPDTRSLLEKELDHRHVSKVEFRNIINGNVPYNLILKDQVILIYDKLSNITDVPPKQDFFEEIEIKNADAYGKLYGARELIRIFSNKGVKINLDRKVGFVIDEYVVQYCDKKTVKDIINKLSQISFTEGEYGKDLCDFTQDEFANLFSNYSDNAFSLYKNIISKYVQWCFENGYTSEDHVTAIQELTPLKVDNQGVYIEQYFTSLHQLLKIIKLADEDTNYMESLPEYAWDNILYPSILLSWLGFDIEEIVNLKITDVNTENKEIFYEPTKKRINNIDPEIMGYIENAKNKAKMASVKYLLFSEGKADTSYPLPVNLVAQRITQLNKIMQSLNVSKKFGLKKIRLSGNYSRIYEYEKYNQRELNTSDTGIISMLCRQEINRSRNNIVLGDYKKWKQIVSGEQV